MQIDYYYVLGIMILYADLQVTLSFFVCTHVCYLHLRVSLYIFLERHCVIYGVESWSGVLEWSLGVEPWSGFWSGFWSEM